jgi:folate-dependent phosphoribosylglycinamide formyltransferase PurN
MAREASALRVGALFSARTDLVSSLYELAAGDPKIEFVAAATDREHDAAETAWGVPVQCFAPAAYLDRVHRDTAIADWLVSHQVALVVTAGWLWLLSGSITTKTLTKPV